MKPRPSRRSSIPGASQSRASTWARGRSGGPVVVLSVGRPWTRWSTTKSPRVGCDERPIRPALRPEVVGRGAEGGGPPLVLAGLAGVRPDAVERVGRRGRRRRGPGRPRGRAAPGTAVITMSASTRADGRRVGTGSVARSTTASNARRAPGPAPRAAARRPRRGDGARVEQVLHEPAPGGDVVGRSGAVGARPAAEPRAPGVAEEHVRGVEAAVHDAGVVEVGQRGGDGGGDTADVGDRAGPAGQRLAGVRRAQLARRLAGAAVRRDGRLEVAAGDQAHHPGVRGVRQRVGLVAQPVDGRGAGGGLDRHQRVAVEVDRDVHVHGTNNADNTRKLSRGNQEFGGLPDPAPHGEPALAVAVARTVRPSGAPGTTPAKM